MLFMSLGGFILFTVLMLIGNSESKYNDYL